MFFKYLKRRIVWDFSQSKRRPERFRICYDWSMDVRGRHFRIVLFAIFFSTAALGAEIRILFRPSVMPEAIWNHFGLPPGTRIFPLYESYISLGHVALEFPDGRIIGWRPTRIGYEGVNPTPGRFQDDSAWARQGVVAELRANPLCDHTGLGRTGADNPERDRANE